jgi:LmbE family N-acetylglucosaminyl deacetylase
MRLGTTGRAPASAGHVPDVGTLLGVWAHPDDEAYLSAGLMAVARRAGHRVAVLTATRGEHGTDDPEAWPPERLASHRERELRESLRLVDVHEHTWLGLADGTLAGHPWEDGVAAVERAIREVRPDTIVTFGPEGMTGHPDHRTVSAWVTEAWRRLGARPSLWYATLTPEFHDAWDGLNREVGLWSDDVPPPVTPTSELAAHVVCTDWLLDAKNSALRAHASQTRVLEDLVGRDTYRSWWSAEAFVAATADPRGR